MTPPTTEPKEAGQTRCFQCENPMLKGIHTCGKDGFPHQEGWEEEYESLWKPDEKSHDRIKNFIHKIITSTHTADVQAFEGMIGEDEDETKTRSYNKIRIKYRNKLRAELRTALSTLKEGK